MGNNEEHLAAGETGEGQPQEYDHFAFRALLAYCSSVLLIIFVGSWLQYLHLALGLAVTEIAFIAAPAGVVLMARRRTLDRGLFSRPKITQLSWSALIAVCVTVVAVYVGISVRKALAGIDVSQWDVTGGSWIFSIILILLPPLCEELLFRPTIQDGLGRIWSSRAAVLWTAFLFALYHLNLLRFPETFLLGFFAGIVYLKTRNFWCAVSVHFLCNLLGPIVWRHSNQLGILLNPVSRIILMAVAIFVAYRMGGPVPQELKGVRPRLNWALFGGPQAAQQPAAKAPWYVSGLLGLVTVLLAGLLVVGFAFLVHQKRSEEVAASYTASQNDVWTVASTEEIRACSELSFQKVPQTPEDLVLSFPFSKASIDSIRCGDQDLPFSQKAPGQYRIDWSAYQNHLPSKTMTVLWRFPVSDLERSRKGFRAPLRSLMPSDGLALTLSVPTTSGFQLEDRYRPKNGPPILHSFRSSQGKRVRIEYGSVGIPIERIEPSQTKALNLERE